MCELLGISASSAVDVTLSFGHLARHGGVHGQPDGWGIAFLEGRDAQVWRDPHAASTSHWARHLAHEPIASPLVVAHIRKATVGAVMLANTQPFVRDLFGRVHAFAHNGSFPDIVRAARPAPFQPLGETDSEEACCQMLAEVALTSGEAAEARRIFAQTARRLSAMGHANLLYASGDHLLVHADRRQAKPGATIGPGLWVLERHCHHASAAEQESPALAVSTAPLRVTIVASVPLTHERWRPLPRGTLLDIAAGEIVHESVAELAG